MFTYLAVVLLLVGRIRVPFERFEPLIAGAGRAEVSGGLSAIVINTSATGARSWGVVGAPGWYCWGGMAKGFPIYQKGGLSIYKPIASHGYSTYHKIQIGRYRLEVGRRIFILFNVLVCLRLGVEQNERTRIWLGKGVGGFEGVPGITWIIGRGA